MFCEKKLLLMAKGAGWQKARHASEPDWDT